MISIQLHMFFQQLNSFVYHVLEYFGAMTNLQDRQTSVIEIQQAARCFFMVPPQ